MLHPVVAKQHDGLLHGRDLRITGSRTDAASKRVGDLDDLCGEGDILHDGLLEQFHLGFEVTRHLPDGAHVVHEGRQVRRRANRAHEGFRLRRQRHRLDVLVPCGGHDTRSPSSSLRVRESTSSWRNGKAPCLRSHVLTGESCAKNCITEASETPVQRRGSRLR